MRKQGRNGWVGGGESDGPELGGSIRDGMSLSGGRSVCMRQCSALQEAWGEGGLLVKEGEGLGQGEQQERGHQQGRVGLGGTSRRCGG